MHRKLAKEIHDAAREGLFFFTPRGGSSFLRKEEWGRKPLSTIHDIVPRPARHGLCCVRPLWQNLIGKKISIPAAAWLISLLRCVIIFLKCEKAFKHTVIYIHDSYFVRRRFHDYHTEKTH
ncbi:MAG: hypothetical protein MJ118_04925 [Clostridia bacterium]|nr:hypothetical protein [Clostridia bacterium]